jgi:hypothetical protein
MAVGQDGPPPLQTPASVCWPPVQEAGLHVVLGSKRSVGQFGFVPSQTSGTSQIPTCGRHDVPACPAGNTQPVAELQLSRVQGFPSSQTGEAPPTQLPPRHRSEIVQASPSLQETVLFVVTQPVAGLQESSVHGF